MPVKPGQIWDVFKDRSVVMAKVVNVLLDEVELKDITSEEVFGASADLMMSDKKRYRLVSDK